MWILGRRSLALCQMDRLNRATMSTTMALTRFSDFRLTFYVLCTHTHSNTQALTISAIKNLRLMYTASVVLFLCECVLFVFAFYYHHHFVYFCVVEWQITHRHSHCVHTYSCTESLKAERRKICQIYNSGSTQLLVEKATMWTSVKFNDCNIKCSM